MTIEPTDEACKAFRRVYNNTHVSPEAQVRASLTAAFATQFPLVEKYAGLVNQLRAIDEERLNNAPYSCEQLCKKAANAIEALCAQAAARPLIEAAERERCERIVDQYTGCLPDVIPQIVEEIRSGK